MQFALHRLCTPYSFFTALVPASSNGRVYILLTLKMRQEAISPITGSSVRAWPYPRCDILYFCVCEGVRSVPLSDMGWGGLQTSHRQARMGYHLTLHQIESFWKYYGKVLTQHLTQPPTSTLKPNPRVGLA